MGAWRIGALDLVERGHPALGAGLDLQHARRLLEHYAPRDDHQALEQRRILEFVDSHPDALLRTCITGHLTASALLLDADGSRGLLTLHKKLGRWLQLGGHVDGEGNLALAALKELEEESGLAGIRIDPRPIDLDIHAIPARGAEPEHLHLDVRFLAQAAQGAREVLSDESLALAWIDGAALASLPVDDSVRRLFRLAGLVGA